MIEREVELRRKRQLTWPDEIAAAMGVEDGSHLVIECDPDTRTAVVRPTLDSYAGALRGAYGTTPAERAEYLAAERVSWDSTR
jgi:bifunctional DNA-binding transcriptional regulator/antitoxin component of YhaV-PrlF toxin-antitoxin module